MHAASRGMRGHYLAGCTPPRMVWTPPLPRLGCLLMSRRSSPALSAASVSAFPRAARETPLVACTYVLRFYRRTEVSRVLMCFPARSVYNVVLHFAVSRIP
jgi:hypothetical protein